MQAESSTGASSGGFFNQLGGFFLDTLDKVTDKVIIKEFGEDASEQSEGIGEFGNPNTVSQPVRQSQLPSGQPLNGFGPLNGFAAQLGIPVSVLVIALGSLAFFLLRKGK